MKTKLKINITLLRKIIIRLTEIQEVLKTSSTSKRLSKASIYSKIISYQKKK